MLEKLREVANPFDFANPVSEERLFFGRTTETADLIYYLNYASQTRKPIHIAFVGARASGKTSFLNMAELEAKRRQFCVVRVNLNEGDVKSDLSFFRKFYQAIVSAAYKNGGFGGQSSASFMNYMDLVAMNECEDREEVPLIFAHMLARVSKAGNSNFEVPDDILGSDLDLISRELDKPVVILVDECNVLRLNRIILEKLRNIFMNMLGICSSLLRQKIFFL